MGLRLFLVIGAWPLFIYHQCISLIRWLHTGAAFLFDIISQIDRLICESTTNTIQIFQARSAYHSLRAILFMDKLDQFIKAVEEEYERTLELASKNNEDDWIDRFGRLLTIKEVAKDYRDTKKILL